MAELEATITLPNGHANSYGDGTVGLTADEARDAVLGDVEQRLKFPGPEQPCDPTTPVAEADATPAATASESPTEPAGDTKPAPPETSREATGPAKKSSTRPARKAQPKDPRVKYVSQAELDAELAILEALSRAALAGDTEAIDRLRIEVDSRPHIWQQLADFQRRIETRMIELIAGNDPLQAQAFRRRCSEFRRQILDGEPASLATRMAAGRAVSCWMFCQLLELRALEQPDGLRNVKSLEQAERRFQVAMRTFHLARQADLQIQRLACQNDAD